MEIVSKVGSQTLETLAIGAGKLQEVVGSTIGPGGSVGAIVTSDLRLHSGRTEINRIFTRDGYRLTKYFFVADPFEQVAVDLLSETAEETAKCVGDGTTTSIILACSIFVGGAKLVAAGHNPLIITGGINKAILTVTNSLRNFAIPFKEDDHLDGLAMSAARDNEEVARSVVKAIKIATTDGYIDVSIGDTKKTTFVTDEYFEISGTVIGKPNAEIKIESSHYVLINPQVLFFDIEIRHQSNRVTIDNQKT